MSTSINMESAPEQASSPSPPSAESSESGKFEKKKEESEEAKRGGVPTTDELLDREERAVAALLTRFKNLVEIATTPVDEGATEEVAAAQGYQMEIESDALVRAAEDLLQMTRELKELWLFGPLRGIGEGEEEGEMETDSEKVGKMIAALSKLEAEKPKS